MRTTGPAERWSLSRFVLMFPLLLVSLLTVELLQPVQTHLILPFTAGVAATSARLVQYFDPDVLAQGIYLIDISNGFTVAIRAGCNGVEASIVLVSAIIAFPSGWHAKLTGIGIGLLLVQLINLLRVITLFYLGQWNQGLFEWAHLYAWQALIILDVLIIFLVWLRYLPGPARVVESS